MKGTYFCYYFCGLSVFMELTVHTTYSGYYHSLNVSSFSYWKKTLPLKHIVHMNYSQSWCFIWVGRCLSISSTVSPVLTNFIDYVHLKAVNTHCNYVYSWRSLTLTVLFLSRNSYFSTVAVLTLLMYLLF